MNQNNFTGFVLAGGKSSRMGTDKFALELNGETFLDSAANALKPVCETVKIVINEHQKIETDLEIIRDIYAERGALGGIHAAFKNCETKFALILAVDLPFVSTEALEKLANFALASNKYIAFVPRQNDEKLQPLCAVYRAKYCLSALENLLNATASASVSQFLDLIAPKIIAPDKLTTDETIDLFRNINYPADFQMLDSKS